MQPPPHKPSAQINSLGLTFAYINVRTLKDTSAYKRQASKIGRLYECSVVADNLQADFMAVVETRIQGPDNMWNGKTGYSYFFSGSTYKGCKIGGVGIGIKDKWMKSFAIEYIHPVNERLMAIWGTIAGHKISIIVAYAPTACSASSAIDTAKFYAELHMLITTVIPSIYRDKCIILGDFNARTGGLQDIDDNYNVLGPYITDDPEQLPYNANGESLVKFCKDHSFRIGNSLYESTAAEGSATWGTTKIHSTTPQHMRILDA